jgi:branched-chain amino acid transport system permease protein
VSSTSDAVPATEIGEPSLSIDGLSVTYRNGAVGCAGVTIDVPHKTVVAVIGRNGAGKTSFLRGIGGFLPPEGVTVRGAVKVLGVPLSHHPVKVSKAGIVFVPEREKVFPSLTVAEHFRLVGAAGMEEVEPFVFDALRSRLTSKAGLLSGGERQMLALAMAWAQRPKILLVDELSLGLAPIIVRQLLRNIKEMVELTDMSVVLVEQDAIAALQVADQLMVMDHGEVVWRGTPSETTAERITAQYLGIEL